jgi:hypothetical protein
MKISTNMFHVEPCFDLISFSHHVFSITLTQKKWQTFNRFIKPMSVMGISEQKSMGQIYSPQNFNSLTPGKEGLAI